MRTRAIIVGLCSIAVGVGATVFLSFNESTYFGNADGYDFAWEKFIVLVAAAFSLVFGAIEPRGMLWWSPTILLSQYFSGFALLTHWGQVPPFELLYVVVLSVPGVFAAYVGALIREQLGNAT